jgi:hypothetical protein
MSTLALIILCLVLAHSFWRERRRRLKAESRTISIANEYRVAFTFVREELADFPHEFAAIFLAGNRSAIEKKFPGFIEFRARILNGDEEEWEGRQ